MSTPALVEAFYARIWNAGELDAVAELLDESFVFRGSLGFEANGREEFAAYVRSVRGALSDYRCEILECITEQSRAFARMRFSGMHTGRFRGFEPTGLAVSWNGAALFGFVAGRIGSLWALGDLQALDRLLERNESARGGR